jgi:hypothetical protein
MVLSVWERWSKVDGGDEAARTFAMFYDPWQPGVGLVYGVVAR